MEKRKVLSEVALNKIPPDTIITNGTVFNVFTREFIGRQSIWIKDGMIAFVGPDPHPLKDNETLVVDAEGQVLLPGLINGHTYIFERSGMEELIKHAIPSGVTTIVTETLEIGTIAGREGIEYFVGELARNTSLPMKNFCL
ncbi:MAG: hypothetical protein ABSH06_28165 [Thermodesulfobacteriota bacterium]|jgi:adenine deaminase